MAMVYSLYITVDKKEDVVPVAMYQGNKQHTGVYETKGVEALPQIKWRFKTGESINSAPIVEDNIVYIGSDDDCIYAINFLSGQEVWRFETEGDIRSTPCIYNDFVFITSQDGNIYALDKNTGEKKWSFSSEEPLHKNDKYDVIIGASPVVENERVYFGSYDGHMYALDINNGSIIWKYKTEASIKSSPALYKGRVYFGSFDGYMYCLDSQNGNLKWRYKTKTHTQCPEGQIYSSPMIYKNVVYFGGSDFHVYALDSKWGKEKWVNYHADQPIYSTLAYKDGIIYYGTVGWHNPKVCAIDINGKEVWEFKPAKGELKNSKGSVYIGSWMNDKHKFTASPIIVDDELYIGSWNKNLYALDRNTGEVKWKFATEGPIGASVAVCDGIIYVGSYDGYLYALGTKL